MAAGLSLLSFDPATRYLLVDDVGAWKAGQLALAEAALTALPPDTVLVLVVRGKALKQLVKAVEQAGGEVREYAAPKPWQLPKWCVEWLASWACSSTGRRRRPGGARWAAASSA